MNRPPWFVRGGLFVVSIPLPYTSMNPILLRHIPHPCQPAWKHKRRSRHRKWWILSIAAVTLALALGSCSGGSSSPPSSPVTDTRPVGEGLKVIGFAMLGASVVLVLGKMLRP